MWRVWGRELIRSIALTKWYIPERTFHRDHTEKEKTMKTLLNWYLGKLGLELI